MIHRTVGRFLFFFASLMFVFSGCRPRETNVQRGDRDQVLHRGMGPEIPDLDPQLALGESDMNVLMALFEGLVTEDPVDLHPVPGVATSWDLSVDGLTYTFHLRPDARWSNGDVVTANDFVRSYQRILTPALGAENAYLFYILQNAEAFNRGELTDFSKVGVKAIDPSTLQLTLEHPASYFLSLLTHMAFMPVPVGRIELYGAVDKRGNVWTRPGHFVGNGPFVLKSWKVGQRLVVTKSPTYWDAKTVRLNEIDFYPIESLDVEERAFRAGQLHLTEAFPVSKVDGYRHDEPNLLRIDPYLATEFIRINVARPFLADVRIRRALSLALDRKSIAVNVLRGGQQFATSFVPPNTAGFTAHPEVEYNADAARELLASAGYPGGKGAPIVELLFNPSESHRVVAEALQESWRRELGLQIRLVQQENKILLSTRRSREFELLRSVFVADYDDPISFLSTFTSDSHTNYTGWSNKTFDELIFEAARLTDPAQRNDRFQKAEALLSDEAPIIPLYFYTHVFAIRPSVKNWNPTLLDHHPYKYVYLQN